MRLVGYSDRLSITPGEPIAFMVSAKHARYRVNLVCLIHGDEDPRNVQRAPGLGSRSLSEAPIGWKRRSLGCSATTMT
jgi:hypothetical protein